MERCRDNWLVELHGYNGLHSVVRRQLKKHGRYGFNQRVADDLDFVSSHLPRQLRSDIGELRCWLKVMFCSDQDLDETHAKLKLINCYGQDTKWYKELRAEIDFALYLIVWVSMFEKRSDRNYHLYMEDLGAFVGEVEKCCNYYIAEQKKCYSIQEPPRQLDSIQEEPIDPYNTQVAATFNPKQPDNMENASTEELRQYFVHGDQILYMEPTNQPGGTHAETPDQPSNLAGLPTQPSIKMSCDEFYCRLLTMPDDPTNGRSQFELEMCRDNRLVELHAGINNLHSRVKDNLKELGRDELNRVLLCALEIDTSYLTKQQKSDLECLWVWQDDLV